MREQVDCTPQSDRSGYHAYRVELLSARLK